MVLKVDGKKCKKVVDALIAKQPKESNYKRIRLWFKPMKGSIIWALIMIGLLSLTVVGFALLTTICNTLV